MGGIRTRKEKAPFHGARDIRVNPIRQSARYAVGPCYDILSSMEGALSIGVDPMAV